MSKKQALTEFHRGSILAAAERLFTEKGVERTTMDDIAKEAEYSKATLYVYFQSKVEIINTILFNGMVMLKKRIHEAAESREDWTAAYDAVCAAVIRFHDENPTAFDVLTGGMRQPLNEIAQGSTEILRVCREIDGELAAFLERGIAAGAVRSGFPVAELVQLLWAAFAGIVRITDSRESYITAQCGLDREEFLRQGERLLLAAITERMD